MLPPAEALPLCLTRPAGLRALLGREGGLPLDLPCLLSRLFALRCLPAGEGLLFGLPFPFGLVPFRPLALGDGLRLPRCLERDGECRRRLSVRLMGEQDEEAQRGRVSGEAEEEEVVLLKLVCLLLAAGWRCILLAAGERDLDLQDWNSQILCNDWSFACCNTQA